MSVVLDYTARIAPAALRGATVIDGTHRHTVVGVCRYIAPQAWKRITLPEYQELRAAGIAVTLNWESDSHDWDGGAARGGSHGQAAVGWARTFSYPPGSVIAGSNDYDMTESGWVGAGRGYCRAFAQAVRAGGYRPGVYGPWDVLTWVRDEGLMDAFWQAGMSTDWSGGRNAKAWPGAHLRQRGKTWVAGQETDWNEVLIPDWGQPTGVEDMAAVQESDRAYNDLLYGVAGLLNGEDVAARKNADGSISPARPNILMAMVRAIAARVDIDAAELAAIEAAAKAGAASAADDIVARVLAGLPAGTLTPATVEQAVRDAFAGGLAPDQPTG